jgi:hypothetical protein
LPYHFVIRPIRFESSRNMRHAFRGGDPGFLSQIATRIERYKGREDKEDKLATMRGQGRDLRVANA